MRLLRSRKRRRAHEALALRLQLRVTMLAAQESAASVMKRPARRTIVFLLAASISTWVGCDSATALANAPEGHTDLKGGAAHAPGSNDPTANCSGCHGVTLEGGTDGEPSCFTCHGREW